MSEREQVVARTAPRRGRRGAVARSSTRRERGVPDDRGGGLRPVRVGARRGAEARPVAVSEHVVRLGALGGTAARAEAPCAVLFARVVLGRGWRVRGGTSRALAATTGPTRRRRVRGVALVPAALALVVLCLGTAAGLALAQAVRERARLQHHVDAQAFGRAVLAARAFNHLAVTNRAIAATHVAALSLHAYFTGALVQAEVLEGVRNNLLAISVEEGAQCAAGGPGTAVHCADAAQAVREAARAQARARSLREAARGLTPRLASALGALDTQADALHASQRAVLVEVERALLAGAAPSSSASARSPEGPQQLAPLVGSSAGALTASASATVRERPAVLAAVAGRGSGGTTGAAGVLATLGRLNAPVGTSDVPLALRTLAAQAVVCAVDGATCPTHASTPRTARAAVMTEVANASRPAFVSARAALPRHLHPRFVGELARDFGSALTLHAGTAKLAETRAQLHGPGQVAGNTGRVLSADEHGWVVTRWRHGLSTWRYEARAWADAAGGGTSGGEAGALTWEGVHARDGGLACLGRGNCFLHLRARADRGADFGQPRLYASARAPLRWRGAPWELNARGRVRIGAGAELGLAPSGEGAAFAAALVYYHRPGEWAEPPNLFNPFWRARLHAPARAEAARVLALAGEPEAAALVAAGVGP